MLEDNSRKIMHDHFRDHKPAAIRTTFGLEVNIFPYRDFFSFHFFFNQQVSLNTSYANSIVVVTRMVPASLPTELISLKSIPSFL